VITGCSDPCGMAIRVYDPSMEKFYRFGLILIVDESSLDSLGLEPQDDKKIDQRRLVFGIS